MSDNESTAMQLTGWLIDNAIAGVGPMSGAMELADEYMTDSGYSSDNNRISAMINWETSKNFTSSFLTGLGGMITLPVQVAGALGASWLVQARLAAAHFFCKKVFLKVVFS